MDRREALLLVERLKRRMRDPDVLALCEYFERKLVDVTPVTFRRPDVPIVDVTPIALQANSCPDCAARRAAATARQRRWRHGRRAQG
jgi:hypothetical protein